VGEKKNTMAKLQFKNEPSNSPELFPENIFDKIPQDHPVRLVKKVVEELNISHILKHYKTGAVLHIILER
jgi:putative uncharacterized protein (fragment)